MSIDRRCVVYFVHDLFLDITYCTIKRWNESQLHFDLEKCLLVPPQDVPKYIFQEKIKGGVLVDDNRSSIITWKERALERMCLPIEIIHNLQV